MKTTNIRNFSIIAHIDHGKSTLADRIMEMTKTVDEREMTNQVLDDMAVEQAHQVTVKARSVRNLYHADDGQDYELNLIDTPGHVDFTYEVSRSLSVSDGVILLVDATQGVQVQTVANYRLARQMELPIIPVINKIDVANAEVEKTAAQIRALDDDLAKASIIRISAKSGQNVHQVLEAIVQSIPAPQGDAKRPLTALVYDTQYDQHQGVIALVRVIDGQIRTNDQLLLMATQHRVSCKSLGVFTPQMTTMDHLGPGDVGYLVTGVKDPDLVRVGDTLTERDNPAPLALPGYQPIKSMVFAGIYPKSSSYAELKSAIKKLALNDPAFRYTEEISNALVPGFRGGFLGVFHLQIIKERLEKEYGIEVLTTAPNVSYHVYRKLENAEPELLVVDNPVDFPDFSEIDHVEEPFVQAEITVPHQYLGEVMKLADRYYGTMLDLDNQGDLVILTYQMPIAKIAYGFFNQLKSISYGFATLNTDFWGYETSDVVKIEIDVNYAPVDSLAFVVRRTDAPEVTQNLVHKLKYTIPRKLYPSPVQAIVEGRVIARVDVPPLRKMQQLMARKRVLLKSKLCCGAKALISGKRRINKRNYRKVFLMLYWKYHKENHHDFRRNFYFRKWCSDSETGPWNLAN